MYTHTHTNLNKNFLMLFRIMVFTTYKKVNIIEGSDHKKPAHLSINIHNTVHVSLP